MTQEELDALMAEDLSDLTSSVDNTDTEKVLRGSNEGFTESVKTNTALIRKRIRSHIQYSHHISVIIHVKFSVADLHFCNPFWCCF